MFRDTATVVLIAILTTGCADLRWQKAGTDTAALERDLAQCQAEGRLQAGRQTIPRLASTPVITTDPQGRAIASQPPPHDTERFLLEQDLTRACMRRQGYELVPADKAVKK